MLYSSYLVFYLNHHDVKIVFPDARSEARRMMHESIPLELKDS